MAAIHGSSAKTLLRSRGCVVPMRVFESHDLVPVFLSSMYDGMTWPSVIVIVVVAEREALADELRRVRGAVEPYAREHGLRVRDAGGLVARAAALEVGLEGDGRVGDVRGRLERQPRP